MALLCIVVFDCAGAARARAGAAHGVPSAIIAAIAITACFANIDMVGSISFMLLRHATLHRVAVASQLA